MPIDQRELMDVLGERSRPALERPVPWESLRGRVRRARRRRRLAVGAAAVLVVAGVGVGVPLGLRTPTDGGPTAVTVVDEIPARYEEPDGTDYRRIATATLDLAWQESVSVEVKLSGRPLAVLAHCTKESSMTAPKVTARVPGSAQVYRLSRPAFLGFACERGRAVDLEPLPDDARTATVTIRAQHPRRDGRWRLGVYEWTPPAEMPTAPAPYRPPASFSRNPTFHKIAQATTGWPGSREVTVRVRSTGRPIALVVACSGAIGGRVTQEVSVNGSPYKGFADCSPPFLRGPAYQGLGRLPKGTVTIRVKVGTDIAAYDHRPGTLTAAVYEGR
ncbi:hypothetical protein [Nonomuraea harbinensis]|uniref:Uncharacterized protein n=1 Tax=Nonomuraea harbinensis TaxID=1286938 RepID=A0ABW1BY56_9ACTN|nr:hypothetical protein [Nonomuraea harbinensis]